MNLTFFTKIFISSAQWGLGLDETFSYEREAVSYIDKGYYAAIGDNNNTCISCVFNGFKYMCRQYPLPHVMGNRTLILITVSEM